MPKDRKTRPFVIWMLVLCPLVVALYVGLWPELDELEAPPIPGEIVFKSERPSRPSRAAISGSSEPSLASAGKRGSGWSMDWLYDRFDDVMSWEHNPWKFQPDTFGNHYFELLGSKDPKDQALVLEIRRLGELLHQRVLERYPELAVADKNVPPEKNGFLKWLEFSERFDADRSPTGERYNSSVEFPESLTSHLKGEGSWDAAAVKAWLAKEKALVDEVRAIGLLEDQSNAGVDLERWNFMPARLAKNCTEALLLDARLCAEEGNIEGALNSVSAANGLADHLGKIETPTLLNATVEIIIQLSVQKYTMSEIIPALPAGQFDVGAWEQAVNPAVKPPADLGRLLVGEWNVTSRWYIMPMLSNSNDPKYPSDPDALIDYHASAFVGMMDAYSGQSVGDWSSVGSPVFPDDSHLSRNSRQVMEMFFVGSRAWSKGFQRSVHASVMNQAAFAIINLESAVGERMGGVGGSGDG